VTDPTEVPAAVLAKLRGVIPALPEAYEEPAWVGIRWRIRTRTFAHVLRIVDGAPLAYARAAGTEGPEMVMTFRASGPELDALANAGAPFFKPVWFTDIVGMALDGSTDWREVAELVTDSYCLLAPKKLAAEVARPEG
jgi:hypothetical protein